MPKRKSCLFPFGSCKCVNGFEALSTTSSLARIYLSSLSDEDLCRVAQGGCNISRDFLWDKYQSFIQKIAFRENHHQHLPQHEMDDVLQELYFAFQKSVQRYDPESHSNGRPASFKTFLRLVIVREFSNCCSVWRRYHKHVVFDFDVNLWCGYLAEASHTHKMESSLVVDWLGPVINEFSSHRLAEILQKLKPKESSLLANWLMCDLDKDLGKLLGISTAAAKLRRERLFHRLRKKHS